MTHLKRLGALSLSLALTLTALSGCQNGASSSSSQGEEPIDLASVTDPYLTTAGLSGDTVVARAGGADITAGSLLYWMAYLVDSSIQDPSSMDTVWELDMGNGQTFEQGILDAALNNAALYALLPIQAQAEGITVSPDLSQQVSNLMTSMETEAGSAELLDHSLWYNALTRDLYTTLFEVNDLNSQLQEKLYGEGSAGYPTDDQVRSFAEGQGYYRAKHILLKTVDTNSPLTDENGNPTGEYAPLDEATVAEKKALAEDLLAQLQAAGDKEALFDQLMAQYSEDTASDGSLNGADGYVASPGQMVAPFEEAAQALSDGEVSGIVESVYGYHIILRLPLDPADFRSGYIAQQMTDLRQGWLDANPVETTEAFAQVDPPAFYEKLLSLRAAIEEEAAALQEASSSSSGSSSSGSSPSSSSSASSPASSQEAS